VCTMCLCGAATAAALQLPRKLGMTNGRPRRAQVSLREQQSWEAKVDVCAAGAKGIGAFLSFAAEPIEAGTWVGTYEGRLTNRRSNWERYVGAAPDYVFAICEERDLYLDAQHSKHFSRYLNHHENGTLSASVCTERRRIDFYAARTIRPGEELTFDYGPSCARSAPALQHATHSTIMISRERSDMHYIRSDESRSSQIGFGGRRAVCPALLWSPTAGAGCHHLHPLHCQSRTSCQRAPRPRPCPPRPSRARRSHRSRRFSSRQRSRFQRTKAARRYCVALST
jgi:hypothetical protein